MEQPELIAPLLNMQLELLNLFTRDLDSDDLLILKRLIVIFLAEKTIRLADSVWDEKNW